MAAPGEPLRGALLSLVGFLYFAGALRVRQRLAARRRIGWALQELFLAAFVHLLLAYPAGTLTRGAKRRRRLPRYAAALGFPTAYLLVAAGPAGLLRTARRARSRSSTAAALSDVLSVAAAVSALAIARADGDPPRPPVARRLARLPQQPPARAVTGARGDRADRRPADRQPVPRLARAQRSSRRSAAIAFLLVPFAFAAGLLRGRFASAAVGRLLAQLGPVPAPGRLARLAAGDARRSRARARLLAARPAGLRRHRRQAVRPGRATAPSTPVDGENGRIGILAHDPALLDRRELLDGVVSAARLALENERLHAELRAQLDALARERDFTRLVVNTAPSFFCVARRRRTDRPVQRDARSARPASSTTSARGAGRSGTSSRSRARRTQVRGADRADRRDRPRLAAREPASRRRRHAANGLVGDGADPRRARPVRVRARLRPRRDRAELARQRAGIAAPRRDAGRVGHRRGGADGRRHRPRSAASSRARARTCLQLDGSGVPHRRRLEQRRRADLGAGNGLPARRRHRQRAGRSRACGRSASTRPTSSTTRSRASSGRSTGRSRPSPRR